MALVALARAARPGRGIAHPLGNFTINQFTPTSSPPATASTCATCSTWPRSRRSRPEDEVAAEGRQTYGRELAAQLRRRSLAHRRRIARRAQGARSRALVRRRGRRSPDDAPRDRARRRPAVLGGPSAIAFADANYPDRLGWREIVVAATSGAAVTSSTALGERHRRAARLSAGPAPEPARRPGGNRPDHARARSPGPRRSSQATSEISAPVRVAQKTENGFTSPDQKESLSIGVILVSLLVAMFWGAAHALTPGHGKAIVAAYLVGTRGTPRHALYLGGIVTITHTIGVFALGVVTLALSEFIVPDELYPWLNLVSALLVVARRHHRPRGCACSSVRGRGTGPRARPSTTHGHEHGHTTTTWPLARPPRPRSPHDHDHGHSHDHGHCGTIISTSRSRARAGEVSSPSESRAGSCPVRALSSCCSRRSRCTASATGSS